MITEEYRTDYEAGTIRLAAQDRLLQTAESIPDDLWRQLCEAISYDSVAPVNWACGRLRVIYLRTENGESISIPAINTVLDKNTFESFISEYFSPAIFDTILKR